MTYSTQTRCIAFEGFRRAASGELADVALKASRSSIVDAVHPS